MSRYNHFAAKKYKTILFDSVYIGDQFRKDSFKNGRRRKDIICIKTGDKSYIEEKSKKEYNLLSTKNLEVSSFKKTL